MTAVPRVYEKLHARMVTQRPGDRGPQGPDLRLGERRGEPARPGAGRDAGPGSALAAAPVGDGRPARVPQDSRGARRPTALRGVRQRALRASLGEFFYGIGLPIIEGYGLTETSPVLSVVPLERVKFGTVGPPLPNVELSFAEDGEILRAGVRTSCWATTTGRPRPPPCFGTAGSTPATSARSTPTATCGSRIARRSCIVTSGGKKIAPQPIEAALRSHPPIHEAVLVGDRSAITRPCCSCRTSPALAARLGVPKPATQAEVEALIDRARRSRAVRRGRRRGERSRSRSSSASRSSPFCRGS